MRQNYFDGKEWYLPPLSVLTFFDTRNVLKNRRVPLRNFSVLWDKNFDIKSWYSLPPSPLLSIKFFDTRNFVKQKVSPTKFFGTLRQQFFYRKSWYSPLIHKIFRYQNFFTYEVFSVLWDNRFSIENRDIPLFGIKFFNTWNFLKHRRVPLRNDSVLRQNFWNTEGFLYEMIRYWDKKILDRKSWCPPPPPSSS